MAKKITKRKLEKVLKACDIMGEVVQLDVLLSEDSGDVLEDTITNINKYIDGDVLAMVIKKRNKLVSAIEKLLGKPFGHLAQLLVDIRDIHFKIRQAEVSHGAHKDGVESGKLAFMSQAMLYISQDLTREMDRECVVAVGNWLPKATQQRDAMIADVFGE